MIKFALQAHRKNIRRSKVMLKGDLLEKDGL